MAGSLNKQNIIVGAAVVFIGPSWDATTGSNPAPSAVVSTPFGTTLTANVNWSNVGFTMEGLEVSYEPDYGDVEVDQLLDSAKLFKQSMRVSLNTTMAEGTLFNLMVAWGQSSSTLNSTSSDATLDIDGGQLGDAPVERGLIAVGNGVSISAVNNNYNERYYHAYRVLSVETTAHALRRNEPTGFPVSFRALPGNNGKYGYVRDRARTW